MFASNMNYKKRNCRGYHSAHWYTQVENSKFHERTTKSFNSDDWDQKI